MTHIYPPNLEEIHALIRKFGPTMVMHPDEKYKMDYPDRLLETGKASLRWGLVNGSSYDAFRVEELGSLPVSSGETLIAAVKAAERDKQPGFDYWLNHAYPVA